MTSPCHSQSNRVCLFCRSASVDEIDLGKIHEKVDVTVHYFCMLLSSGLTQNTRVSDKKSILGFTLSDIRKEALRGRRLKCCFCKSKGATIGCCVKTCKKAFHLTCGRQNGTMHHFFNDFRSYCGDHIEQQNFAVRKSGKKSCIICLGALSTLQAPDTLSSPCCKAASFHRRCIQQYALSAGMHFFKCPMCNAVKEFQAEMMKFGIYIPDQDASWEKEPNAFQELLERHDTCDAESCLCPRGRQHSESVGQYMLSLCQNCGSFGSHKACGALVRKYKNLVCPPCSEILEESEKKRRSEGVKSISKVVKKSAVQRVRKRDSRALNSQFDRGYRAPEVFETSSVKDILLLARVNLNWESMINRCVLQCTKIDQELPLTNGKINVSQLQLDTLGQCVQCVGGSDDFQRGEDDPMCQSAKKSAGVHTVKRFTKLQSVPRDCSNILEIRYVCNLRGTFFGDGLDKESDKENIMLFGPELEPVS